MRALSLLQAGAALILQALHLPASTAVKTPPAVMEMKRDGREGGRVGGVR